MKKTKAKARRSKKTKTAKKSGVKAKTKKPAARIAKAAVLVGVTDRDSR